MTNWLKSSYISTLVFSTSDAKSDFMKVIRQTIRESVRKMIIPSATSPSSSPHQANPHHQHKSPSVSPRSRPKSEIRGHSPVQHHPMSSPQLAMMKRRMKSADSERHSMDCEKKIGDMDLDAGFRTRSKTIGNLTDASMDESGGFVPGPLDPNSAEKNKENSSCSSNSNISCSSQTGSHSGSARLQYASADPLNYSSSSVNSGDRDGAASPVWKRAADSKVRHSSKHDESHSDKNGGHSSKTGQASRRDTKTVVFAPLPDGIPHIKDTEC